MNVGFSFEQVDDWWGRGISDLNIWPTYVKKLEKWILYLCQIFINLPRLPLIFQKKKIKSSSSEQCTNSRYLWTHFLNFISRKIKNLIHFFNTNKKKRNHTKSWFTLWNLKRTGRDYVFWLKKNCLTLIDFFLIS